MRKPTSIIQITVMSMLAMFVSVSLVSSAVEVDTSELRAAVTVDGVRVHQQAFQDDADANGGTRLAGTAGYDDSADYVTDQMLAAGYEVTVQVFDFVSFRPLGPSTLEQTAPGAVIYVEDTDYNVMSQSEPGDVTGLVTGVDLALADPSTSTSGCEASDFAGFLA